MTAKLDRNGRNRFVQLGVTVIMMGLALFLSAGRLSWWNGWLYLAVYVACLAGGGGWMVRHHPDVINERGRSSPNTKPFDRIIAPFYLVTAFGQLVLAGLDARFGWSSVPLGLVILGVFGMLVAMLITYWAMANNPFLATTVRIQNDRDHRVASTGPYRIVRHPMYAATLYTFWQTAFLLGSWWTLLLAFAGVVVLMIRTALEDRTLQAELAGYREYAAQVRYRLIPGVW